LTDFLSASAPPTSKESEANFLEEKVENAPAPNAESEETDESDMFKSEHTTFKKRTFEDADMFKIEHIAGENEDSLRSNSPPLRSEIEHSMFKNEHIDRFIRSKNERNMFDIEHIEEKKETVSGDKDTGVHLRLDEIRLRAELAALKTRKYTRCELAVASELYRYGERLQELEYTVVMEKFCEEIGVSRTSCWSALKKLKTSDMFKMLLPVKRVGTKVHLDGSFFLEQDRRKNKRSIYQSIRNYQTTFFSCLARLLIPRKDLTSKCEEELLRFGELLRRNRTISSGDKSVSDAGKLLHAVCSMLLRGKIERPSAYLVAVIAKESERLLERLSEQDMERSAGVVSVLEKAFKEDVDELSGDEWTLLLGEKTTRQAGVARFVDLVSSALAAKKTKTKKTT